MIDKLHDELSKSNLETGHYLVQKINSKLDHYLAIDKDKKIALLIDNLNSNGIKLPPFKGKNLDVLYNLQVEVIEKEKSFSSNFTLLQLKSTELNTQLIFIKICEIITNNLGNKPEIKLVQKEVNLLIEIFSNFSNKPIKDELGLWGELFVISIQDNKEAAIKSWHNYNTNRIDFNSGNLKIEIKTTTLNERRHTFKLNQLISQFEENIYIGSIVTEEIDSGKSIPDLIREIESGLNPKSQILFFKKISTSLGDLGTNIDFKSFDYEFALSNFKIFHSKNIPCIRTSNIPNEISEIQFSVLLDSVQQEVLFENKRIFN